MDFTSIAYLLTTTRALARGLNDLQAEEVWNIVYYDGPRTPASQLTPLHIDNAIRRVKAK